MRESAVWVSLPPPSYIIIHFQNSYQLCQRPLRNNAHRTRHPFSSLTTNRPAVSQSFSFIRFICNQVTWYFFHHFQSVFTVTDLLNIEWVLLVNMMVLWIWSGIANFRNELIYRRLEEVDNHEIIGDWDPCGWSSQGQKQPLQSQSHTCSSRYSLYL